MEDSKEEYIFDQDENDDENELEAQERLERENGHDSKKELDDLLLDAETPLENLVPAGFILNTTFYIRYQSLEYLQNLYTPKKDKE